MYNNHVSWSCAKYGFVMTWLNVLQLIVVKYKIHVMQLTDHSDILFCNNNELCKSSTLGKKDYDGGLKFVETCE